MKALFDKIAGEQGVAVPPVENASRGKREQGRARADARGAGHPQGVALLYAQAAQAGRSIVYSRAIPCGWPVAARRERLWGWPLRVAWGAVVWGGVGMGLVIWMF